MKTIKNVITLTADQEYQIAKRAQNGDQEAKKILMNANLELVEQMVKKTMSKGNYTYNVDEIQEEFRSAGFLGLAEAANKFDPDRLNEKGQKAVFESCARFYINKYMIDYKYTIGRNVRLPDSVFEDSLKIEEAENEYIAQFGEEPSIQQLAKFSGYSVKRIKTVRQQIQKESSTDEFTGDDDKNRIIDLIGDGYDIAGMVSNQDRNETLASYIQKLTKEEQFIVCARYRTGEKPIAYQKIAKALKISQAKVKKLESLAISQLKKELTNAGDGFISF